MQHNDAYACFEHDDLLTLATNASNAMDSCKSSSHACSFLTGRGMSVIGLKN